MEETEELGSVVVDEGLASANLTWEEKAQHKNWKIRCEGYEDLKALLNENKDESSFRSKCAILLTKMTSDSNPNGLDIGLDVCIMVFEVCANIWKDCDQEKLLNNIVDKTFGARQTTVQRGKALLLKIVETNDAALVTQFLLGKLSDRRPKVPPTCLDLITEGLILFGAHSFPIKDLLKSLPAIFNSSNSSARESVMSLVVELHRWIGIAPIQPLLENLRPAQRSDFEKLISTQSNERPIPSLGLRSDRLSGKLESQSTPVVEARDMVDEVDLAKKLKGSDFTSLVSSEKWADQVQALDFLVQSIGSTPKIKYNSTVTDTIATLHQLLKNGHIQVQIKWLKVIALFADGCRSKVSAEMRNVIPTVVGRAKEKKISDDVLACLLSIFSHCTASDPFVAELVEQMISKKNPPHTKICLGQVLIALYEKNLLHNGDSLRSVFNGFVVMSDDSDGKVRDLSIISLQKLRQMVESSKHREVVIQLLESLNISNSKLSKRVLQPTGPEKSARVEESALALPQEKPKAVKALNPSEKLEVTGKGNSLSETANLQKTRKGNASSNKEDEATNEEISLSSDEAMSLLSERIGDKWNSIVSNLSSAKWQEKVEGVAFFQEHSSSLQQILEPVYVVFSALGILKSSNVNVLKAGLESLLSLIKSEQSISRAIAFSVIDATLEKIADKKLQTPIENLFQEMMGKADTKLLLKKICVLTTAAKSPLVHQGIITWLKSCLEKVRVSQIPVQQVGQLCISDLENKNSAVRLAAMELVKFVYSRIGSPFLSCVIGKDTSPQVKNTLELELSKVEVTVQPTANDEKDQGDIDLPRKDLAEYLEKSILNELNCVEGKDSWQTRKSAMDKISDACRQSGYFLEFNKMSTETIKALKPRLVDTQSNLKPVAMQTLGQLISSLAADKIGKCLKIIVQPILLGLIDNKKPMRDATISTLETIVTLHGRSVDSAVFMLVVNASGEVLISPIGRLELLTWMNSHQQQFQGDCSELTQSLLSALQDKTAQVRSECEKLLMHLIANNFIPKSIFEKFLRDLAPAVKRSLQNATDRILSVHEAETVVTIDHPPTKQHSIPEPQPVASHHAVTQHTTTHHVPKSTVETTQRSSRRDDWLKWPHYPSLPSLYDMSILKNKWKKDFPSNSILKHDLLDSSSLDVLNSISSTDLAAQIDYVLRLVSYHLANTKDDSKLKFLLQILCSAFHHMQVTPSLEYDDEEILLLIPQLLNRLVSFSRSGVMSLVMSVIHSILHNFSARGLLQIIFSTFPAIEDHSCRMLIWDCVNEIFVASRDTLTLSEADLHWFIYLKNHKVLREERQKCLEVLGGLYDNGIQVNVEPLLHNLQELLHLNDTGEKKPHHLAETIKHPPVTFNSLVEDFVVVVTVPEKINVSQWKDIAEKTRIVLSTGHSSLDAQSHRRLPDLIDIVNHVSSDSSKFEASFIHCSLATLNFLMNQIPNAFSDLTLPSLKRLVLALSHLVVSQVVTQTAAKASSLILLSMSKLTHPVNFIATVLDLITSQGISHLVGFRLVLFTVESSQTSFGENYGSLSMLMNHIAGLMERGSPDHVKLCKVVLRWCLQNFSSEKLFGFVESSLVLENLKSLIDLQEAGDKYAESDQVIDIINEITFSRDKGSAISKLHSFRRAHPDLDINSYLSKLSAPFQRYVTDELARLDEAENTENNELVSSNSTGSRPTEALMIIENLKAKPPAFSMQEGSKAVLAVTKSPLPARSDRIRDTLSELSRNLDLPTSLNNSKVSYSETLEERLQKLKSLN